MQPRGPSWSEFEVEATVADYFSMLEKELRGIPYSKAEHRRALRPLLDNRSDGAIERKHQNITAILIEAHAPYIRGYKPLSQYQHLLADVVLERLEEDAGLQQLARAYADAPVTAPIPQNILDSMTQPPDLLEAARLALSGVRLRRAMKGIDYVAREAMNRAIGVGGEKFVVDFERARLSSLGHDVLAERVEHVALTRGDGLGYDVLSFEAEGRERYIEVKTTKLGPMTPFYVTANELSFSLENRAEYNLYRLYDFASTPAMFQLAGGLDATCAMVPDRFIALAVGRP